MSDEKSKIGIYFAQNEERLKRKPRIGFLTPAADFILIIAFALFLLPLFLFMLVFNHAYFWLRYEKPVGIKSYVRFDRHQIPHLSLVDKIWCEYCEWANGGLQWIIAIVHEIERRYCPIKNKCNPHCAKAKKWREDFLEYDHQLKHLKNYYQEGEFKDISVVDEEKP